MHRLVPRWIAALACVLSLAAATTNAAAADDVVNDVDAADNASNKVDATPRVHRLTHPGPEGSVTLQVLVGSHDGDDGCNIDRDESLTIDLTSSDPRIATVTPAVIFTDCEQKQSVAITPQSTGSATITASLGDNETGSGSYTLFGASFEVIVSDPPNTPPTVTVGGVEAGARYPLGVTPAAVCTAADAEDGPSVYAAALSAFSGPDAAHGFGSRTARCSYTDRGGLTAVSSVRYVVVDDTPPTVSDVVTPASPNGSNGWYVTDAVIRWTVTEDGATSTLETSGCDDLTVGADQAEATYTCTAISDGGPASGRVTIKRDSTRPTVGVTVIPAANGAGWRRADATVTYTCGDALAGVAIPGGCPAPQTLRAEGAAVPYSGTARDQAGNTETVNGSVKIDRTAPTVAVTGVTAGATYTLGSIPAAACSASDALSGVAAPGSPTISGGPIGTVTATCSGATDIAGNVAPAVSVTYDVAYPWSGFFQPVDPQPTLNRVKAGTAVPVRFSLGGNHGPAVMAPGFPTAQVTPCANAAAADVEETVNAANSSLMYDTASDEYVYIFKTRKAWTNTCRTLTVKLADGTSHLADFQFVK